MSTMSFEWDPYNIEIKTKSLRQSLEPLVVNVTQLISSDRVIAQKQRSKKSKKVIGAVQNAVFTLTEAGKAIAKENDGYKHDLLDCVEDMKRSGGSLNTRAIMFVSSPLDQGAKMMIMEAARELLSSVTKLLMLADFIDVQKLVSNIETAEKSLKRLRQIDNSHHLEQEVRKLQSNFKHILQHSLERHHDLLDPVDKRQLWSGLVTLDRGVSLLLSTTTTHLQHSDVPHAADNRDVVIGQLGQALQHVSQVLQGHGGVETSSSGDTSRGIGDLIAALDSLDEMVAIDLESFDSKSMRLAWEGFLESIVSGAATVADGDNTTQERRHRIVMASNNVRQALQELLQVYSDGLTGGQVDTALENMLRRTKDLRRQLRKAVVDNVVSDKFQDRMSPLELLIDAARAGDKEAVTLYTQVFTDHAIKLVEVAELAVSMSDDIAGVRLVRQAAEQVGSFYRQVINAAMILTLRPGSQAAHDNMEVFRQSWQEAVILLTQAVDNIVTIDDFLAVTENHVLEDIKRCCLAMKQTDLQTLTSVAASIEARARRISEVVTAEMDSFEAGVYTENVLEAVRVLQSVHVPNFVGQVDIVVEHFLQDPPALIDENEFLESSRFVYDGVRDIRRAVLIGIIIDEIQTDSEEDSNPPPDDGEDYVEVVQEDVLESEYPDDYGIDSTADAMKRLPEAERSQIAEKVEEFLTEQEKFDQEVSKWREEGNDLVMLALRMREIMKQMTDFTQGEGPLRTSADIISAAQTISELGTRLDKLARMIADRCPESTTKRDLLAYLQRIALYCHQLDICSKVKAEVTIISGELVISVLDSATSLIQAAKNLMTSVLLTVKACYLASTKYKHQDVADHPPLVKWMIKSPERRPLLKRELSHSHVSAVRKTGDDIENMSRGKYLYKNVPLFGGFK